MRERLHVTFHAKTQTIPLRVGKVLDVGKIYIENAIEDAEGTGNQTLTEKAKGNIHLLVDIWTDVRDGNCLGRWRIVVGRPAELYQDRALVTVLQQENNEIKTENSLTDRLKNAVNSNPWITPEYIVANWHPLYKAGVLKNGEDLNKLINEFNLAPVKKKITELESENQKQALYIKELEDAQKMNKLAEIQLDKEVMGPAKKVTQEWPSKTGSKYLNYGVDAYIEKVIPSGDKIQLTFIDEEGKTTVVEDFGFNGLVTEVLKYLSNKIKSRAVFILTYQPGGRPRLASDTMLLPAYKNIWN
jgi:hypothetical protein